MESYGEISPTITATITGIHQIDIDEEEHMDETANKRYRIRKLTPRECGRLMGVSDTDIDKMLDVVSNSQAYKQYGNSIVVPVLMAIFSQLGIAGVRKWNDLSEDEIYELIGER